MFEKWRIKEHMEVVDAAGRPVGRVDALEGDAIRLTRADAPDGRHHVLDLDCVERVEDGCVRLKAGVPLPDDAARQEDAVLSPKAVAAGYHGQERSSAPAREDPPLFGTSGRGTGMGGSGVA